MSGSTRRTKASSSSSSSSQARSAPAILLVVLIVVMMMMMLTLCWQTVTKQRGGVSHVAAAFHQYHHHHHHHHNTLLQRQQQRPSFVMMKQTKLFFTATTTTEDSSSSSISNEQQTKQQQQQQQRILPTGSTSERRLSSNGLVLDLRCLTQNLPTVLSHLQARHASAETIQSAHDMVALAERRVALIQQRDAFLNQRKVASATVGQCTRQLLVVSDPKNATTFALSVEQQQQRDDIQAQLDAAKEISSQAADGASQAEDELSGIQATLDALLAGIPNLLDDVVPDGKDDQDNVVVSTWGDVQALPRRLGWFQDTDDVVNSDGSSGNARSDADDDEQKQHYKFVPAWHDDVATRLNGYRAEQAVQMSGTRFVALSGVVAQLERALASFFLDLHTTQHGYTEVSVPFIVSRQALMGTSQLPKFEPDLFAITPSSHTCNGQDAFLIPTAEVPVTNLHAGQILDEIADQLPISYVSCTPCFRAEAGSYGRDTKGLVRTHQFLKVELVKITTAETSDAQHELLTSHAEACLQALELPYRKVRLCSGDTGFAARHCYDLEVWLPGAREYREISSCSNTGDFQARRMALRYRPAAGTSISSSSSSSSVADKDDNDKTSKKKKMALSSSSQKVKPVYCHTINGSGLAVGRALVAVLENYQTPDGSVVVPKVLQPYMGGKEILLVPPSSSTLSSTT